MAAIPEKVPVASESEHHEHEATATLIDPVIEARVRRKLDIRLMPVLTLVYLFAFIDRSNAGNARVLGMGEDLELTSNRFNIGLTGFFVTYVLLEVPTNILCKMVGPKIWIPFLAVSFGTITMCMSTMQSYHGFVAARVCLGMFEAGIMPGISYTLSCLWVGLEFTYLLELIICSHSYRRHELVSRVGLYASVASASGAFGGLLATGFTQIPQWGIIHSWRNIFFFEGLISIVIGVTAFFILPSAPHTASFLTAEERQVATARVTLDLKTSHIEPLKAKYVRRAIFNLNTILISLASFCSLLTMNSMALFVPSILNAMGYSGIHSQLLSVPPYVWAATVCISASLLSDRFRRRGIFILAVMPVTLLGFILLLIANLPLGVRYLALFFCLTGAFTASPMFVAWSIENSAGHTTRAIVAGTVVGFGNIGGLLAAWTYLSADAPRYVRGHSLNAGFSALCILIVAAAMGNLYRENKIKKKGGRDYRVAGKEREEVRDLGHEHPEFFFTL